jgi:transcriptional regulator with XRE-family HTH domain
MSNRAAEPEWNTIYDQTMNVARKLHDLRKEKDLTQAEVAKAVGVHQRHVSSWETGKTMPSLETLLKLSKFFGVSIDYLVSDNIPREGVEAINDFDLYETFKKTEALPKEKRDEVRDIVDALVFREKVKNIPEADLPVQSDAPKPEKTETRSLRKVAGKR